MGGPPVDYLDRMKDLTKQQLNRIKANKELEHGWRSNQKCLKSVFSIVPPEVKKKMEQ